MVGGVVGVARDGGVVVGGIVAIEGPAEVKGAVAVVRVAAGRAGVAGRRYEDLGSGGRRERTVLREYGGDGTGYEWSAGGGAVDVNALAVLPRGLHAVARGGERERGPGVGECDLLAGAIDGADGDDAGISGGPGELSGLVIAGGSDDDGAALDGIADRGVEGGGGGIAAEADVNDFRAGIHGGDDGVGDRKRVTRAAGIGHSDTEETGGGSDAGGVVVGTSGERGDRGAVAVFLTTTSDGAEPDVQSAETAGAEGGVGEHAGVENGDGHALPPLAVFGGDAEEREGGVAERDVSDIGAVFLGGCDGNGGDVDEGVGREAGVVGGVVREVGAECFGRVEAHADGAEGGEFVEDDEAGGFGAGEEATISGGVFEREQGLVGAGVGAAGEESLECGEERLRERVDGGGAERGRG